MTIDEVDAGGPVPMLASYSQETMHPVPDRHQAGGGQ